MPGGVVMTITATTLASACGAGDPTVAVTSATGITAPNFTSGVGITYLFVDQEMMVALAVNGVVITVLRGQNGTPAQAHVSGSQVQIGVPSDFAAYGEYVKSSITQQQTEASLNWPATFLSGTTDALTGASAGFWVVKTGSADAITLATPLAAHEGNIINIWSDTAFAHTVTCPTTNFLIGAAANKTVCTFPARPGAGISVRVCNLNYHLLNTSGTGTNSGPVVWT